MTTLSLQPETAPAKPASAWFIPGADPAHWLDVLGRAGLAGAEVRLFVVPQSAEERRPAGILVIGAQGNPPPDHAGALACRCRAERLFFPAEAELFPPVEDEELVRLAKFAVLFFHPTLGLTGFEETDALGVADLLRAPAERSADWNHARAGAPPLPRLQAIVLADPPAAEDVFGEESRDIGADAGEPLPPAPNEPANDTLAKARQGMERWLAQGVGGVMRRLPHTGSTRTWVNQLEDWAARRLGHLSQQLEQSRHRELHRLLHLLAKDPEAGLRHAIPLSQLLHRGTASPGGRLGERALDFNLGRLGGQPADFWNVPGDIQQHLIRHYRDLANRELRLGRHRRAAYIFAELLGDLDSAASALRQGRSFREAAILFEERLGRKLEAARCLAEGGFWAEALERLEQLGEFVEAAELCLRLEDVGRAKGLFRLAVDLRLRSGDVLGAATLLEERLGLPDEALGLLQNAWPNAGQAGQCLAAEFELMGRLGRHGAVGQRLQHLREHPVAKTKRLPLAGVLAGLAERYPEALVRSRAADDVRLLAAAALGEPDLPVGEAAPWVELVTNLAPQDRLLRRDGNRHLAGRRAAVPRARPKSRPEPPTTEAKPVVVRTFDLPRQILWLQVVTEAAWFFAAGTTRNRLTVLRGVWPGEFQSVSWPVSTGLLSHGLVLEPGHEHGRRLLVAPAATDALSEEIFPSDDLFEGVDCRVGTPSWLPKGAFPIAVDRSSVWTVRVVASRAVLSCHDKQGALLRTLDVTTELLTGAERTEETRLSLATLAHGVAVALGNRLVLSRGDGGFTQVPLPGQVVRLVPTLAQTRPGVVIVLQTGALVHWSGNDEPIEVEGELPSPLVAWLPAGPLVLLAGNEGRIVTVDSRGVHQVQRFRWDGAEAIGLAAAGEPNTFAVFTANGHATVFRLP